MELASFVFVSLFLAEAGTAVDFTMMFSALNQHVGILSANQVSLETGRICLLSSD